MNIFTNKRLTFDKYKRKYKYKEYEWNIVDVYLCMIRCKFVRNFLKVSFIPDPIMLIVN